MAMFMLCVITVVVFGVKTLTWPDIWTQTILLPSSSPLPVWQHSLVSALSTGAPRFLSIMCLALQLFCSAFFLFSIILYSSPLTSSSGKICYSVVVTIYLFYSTHVFKTPIKNKQIRSGKNF